MTIEVKAFLIFAGFCWFIYLYLERSVPRELRDKHKNTDNNGGVFIDGGYDGGGDCGGGGD